MMRWNHHFPSGPASLKISATCLLAFLCVSGWTAPACNAGEVVFSSNARFRIPYQLDQAEIRRLRAREIQLHVSTDQGKTWRNVDAVPPVAGKFTFEAGQDGEYWFSVRTISEDGRHHPAGPLAAGLKVHVDTEFPTLDLELSELEAGRVGLRWSAADDHLAADSLRIEYRAAPEKEWVPVQVAEAAGQTNWTLPQAAALSVRGTVRDRAGNEAAAQDELTITTPVTSPQPAAPAPAPTAPARHSRQPIAEGALPRQDLPTAAPLAANADQQPVSNPDPAPMTALPVINPYGNDYSQFISQRETSPPPAAATTPGAPEQPAGGPSSRTTAGPLPAAPGTAMPPQSATPPPGTQPPGTQRVNSTSFQIGYALEDVGPSGVSSVDLFLTEDNGGRWFHYGADDDATSPFEVTVPADGDYGFAIRVRSGVGLSQAPPQPGEAPEVTIAVDRQPPQITLMPLKQGSAQQPGQVLIEWSVSDEQLARQPVRLSYASQPGGPWQPITDWESNSGRHLWTPGPKAPPRVYVRLEARDAAGNIAAADSAEGLVIDLSRPSARILDVDPTPTRN